MNTYIETYVATADETKAEICNAKCIIKGYRFENNHTSAVYVQLFNKRAADVTVGTTVADVTLLLPASGVCQIEPTAFAHFFNKGLTIACTSSRSNNTAPGADANVIVWFSRP